MRIVRNILLCGWMVLIFGGCSSQKADALAEQTEKIEKFMTSTLGLVSEEEAFSEQNSNRELNFYTKIPSTVYRYITNYYEEDRRERTPIRAGSLVQLTLSIYDFSSVRRIGDRDLPLYTNDPAKIELLEKEGLNTAYWESGAYYVRVGEGLTVKGLELSLEGCYEGDVVELYMTYPMAYDKKAFYTLPAETPVAIHFTVDVVFEEEN